MTQSNTVNRNTPPIDNVPSELSDEKAAGLLEKLHQIVDALEQHYARQLNRLEQSGCPLHRRSQSAFDGPESDPPF